MKVPPYRNLKSADGIIVKNNIDKMVVLNKGQTRRGRATEDVGPRANSSSLVAHPNHLTEEGHTGEAIRL